MDVKKLIDGPSVVGKAVAAAESTATLPVRANKKPVPAPSYDWLGPSLRRMYDEVLNEAIPDSFVDLLKQLHDRQQKR